ncbi:MAG TPA: hypothetical protein VNX26_13695 [Candidatus Acidoferrum sp.]|nr:hypothetical protein [Candidatus Acidoferrum sp.]
MLTVDQYAASVVEKYQVSKSAGSPSHHAADAVIPMLQQWCGQHLLGIALSGAYAKGTAITLSSSVDIVLSLHLSSETEVRSEFWKLFEYLADQNLQPHTRTVSLQVESNGLRVDLVPAWSTGGGDQILYHKEPGSPFRTNVAQHVHLITNAGRSQEICALKIWRERHALDFPSFYMELSTLLALEGERFGQLAENVFTVLRYFAGPLAQAVIRDPANPDNVISDDLTHAQKKNIAQAAHKALEDDDWERIIW